MLTGEEYNAQIACESDGDGDCRAGRAMVAVERPTAFDAPTAVRMLQRRHDRMKDLLVQIFVMFSLGMNRAELEASGNTGKAVLYEVDRWRTEFESMEG